MNYCNTCVEQQEKQELWSMLSSSCCFILSSVYLLWPAIVITLCLTIIYFYQWQKIKQIRIRLEKQQLPLPYTNPPSNIQHKQAQLSYVEKDRLRCSICSKRIEQR